MKKVQHQKEYNLQPRGILFVGPGTEVYQGLAAVIVGGMSVSAVFTLILLPSLLRLGETRSAPAIAPTGASAQA